MSGLWCHLSVTQLTKKENSYFNETYLNILECNPDIPDLTILKGHIYFCDQTIKLKPPLSFYFQNVPSVYLGVLSKCLSWDFELQALHRVNSVLPFFIPPGYCPPVERDFTIITAQVLWSGTCKVQGPHQIYYIYLDTFPCSRLQGARALLKEKPPRTPVQGFNLTLKQLSWVSLIVHEELWRPWVRISPFVCPESLDLQFSRFLAYRILTRGA